VSSMFVTRPKSGVAPSTVQRWARTMQIPSVWISARCIRFRPEQVMTALGAARRGSSRRTRNS
ncbi:MAG: hypothetical protein ACOYN0_19505, partial [Phycisphaerales bacterium]